MLTISPADHCEPPPRTGGSPGGQPRPPASKGRQRQARLRHHLDARVRAGLADGPADALDLTLAGCLDAPDLLPAGSMTSALCGCRAVSLFLRGAGAAAHDPMLCVALRMAPSWARAVSAMLAEAGRTRGHAAGAGMPWT